MKRFERLRRSAFVKTLPRPRRASVLVNDYAGHPFQYELSRHLAENGDLVVHQFCATNLTPHARLVPMPMLEVAPIELVRQFDKYRLGRRALSELEYGLRSVAQMLRRRPRVMVTSNVPMLSLVPIAMCSWLLGTTWVLWMQDIQSGLVAASLGRDSPVTRTLGVLERWIVRRPSRVVVISSQFRDFTDRAGVDPRRVDVVGNWAPLDEIAPGPKSNTWSVEQGLAEQLVFLYSGTLGRKHDWALLYKLAAALDGLGRVVVVSEGEGADHLREQQDLDPLPNLDLHDFQPYEKLRDVLATGDVLVTLLSEEAGQYSLPSKALTYMAAGRPILASLPLENECAQILRDAGCAVLVGAGDDAAFLRSAVAIAVDPGRRRRLGASARTYAEQNFNVADKVPRVLGPCVSRLGP